MNRDFDKQSFLKQGAIFSKNEVVWLLWGPPQIHHHRPEAIALLVRDFLEPSNASWLLYPFAMQLSFAEAQNLFSRESTEVRWDSLAQESFRKQFSLIEEKFASGTIEKAVPYTFESASFDFSPSHLENFIGCALNLGKDHIYGQWEDNCGFLGLSPETLICQLSENQFKTMALAGTCTVDQYEANPSAFLDDPKEKIEHLKVVEDLVNQLEPLGELLVSETSVKITHQLAHLFTAMELKTTKPHKVEQMVELLHPTPALGVFPRKEAWKLLRTFDAIESRGRFGAPFGISYSRKKADILVAIRNLSWDASKLKIGAGCGVVKSSEFEKEWNELKVKRNSVKKIFGIK